MVGVEAQRLHRRPDVRRLLLVVLVQGARPQQDVRREEGAEAGKRDDAFAALEQVDLRRLQALEQQHGDGEAQRVDREGRRPPEGHARGPHAAVRVQRGHERRRQARAHHGREQREPRPRRARQLDGQDDVRQLRRVARLLAEERDVRHLRRERRAGGAVALLLLHLLRVRARDGEDPLRRAHAHARRVEHQEGLVVEAAHRRQLHGHRHLLLLRHRRRVAKPLLEGIAPARRLLRRLRQPRTRREQQAEARARRKAERRGPRPAADPGHAARVVAELVERDVDVLHGRRVRLLRLCGHAQQGVVLRRAVACVAAVAADGAVLAAELHVAPVAVVGEGGDEGCERDAGATGQAQHVDGLDAVGVRVVHVRLLRQVHPLAPPHVALPPLALAEGEPEPAAARLAGALVLADLVLVELQDGVHGGQLLALGRAGGLLGGAGAAVGEVGRRQGGGRRVPFVLHPFTPPPPPPPPPRTPLFSDAVLRKRHPRRKRRRRRGFVVLSNDGGHAARRLRRQRRHDRRRRRPAGRAVLRAAPLGAAPLACALRRGRETRSPARDAPVALPTRRQRRRRRRRRCQRGAHAAAQAFAAPRGGVGRGACVAGDGLPREGVRARLLPAGDREGAAAAALPAAPARPLGASGCALRAAGALLGGAGGCAGVRARARGVGVAGGVRATAVLAPRQRDGGVRCRVRRWRRRGGAARAPLRRAGVRDAPRSRVRTGTPGARCVLSGRGTVGTPVRRSGQHRRWRAAPILRNGGPVRLPVQRHSRRRRRRAPGR
eukprot:Rhum_TRINITY_DN14575_c14_g6::Rhum_TRINITY_DN14575_c14_g6_i1::g.99317::m.99317